MSMGLNITEPFEQILKRLEELKRNPELFSEIANIFEQIRQIERYTNTAINTLQNYYLQFSKQVDILSGLIDFQTKINYSVSHQEIVNQIYSFLKEYIPFQEAFLYLKFDEKDQQFEIIAEADGKKDRFVKFLTKNNVERITGILKNRDLGVLISDVNEDQVEDISWDLISARSIILFPIRMSGNLFGFGLLIHRKDIFQLNHLAFTNLVSGFISQTVFHYFYFSRLKSQFPGQSEFEKDFEKHRDSEYFDKDTSFVFRLDSKGIIIYTNTKNQKRLYNNKELIGEKFLNLVEQDRRKPLQNILNQIKPGEVRHHRAQVTLNTQDKYILDLYITKIEIQKNFVVTIIFGVDMTKDYYRSVQKNRNEILDEITRSSQIVNGYLENLLKQLVPIINLFKTTIKDNETMQVFENSVQQTSRLVQGFLKFDVSESELRKEVNINDTISGVLKELKQKLLKDVEVKYSFAPDIPKMLTYQSKIKRMLEIFSQNSFEAIKDRGYIHITTKLINIEKDTLLKPNLFFLSKGKYIEITFEDNGMGINPRVLPQIFKPFFSTKIRNNGIGLGLFIAYNIVKDLEGEIFVKSKQNEYTRFYVYIPYKGDLEMQEILPGMAEAIKEKSPTILVVDDEFNIRSMLKEVFEMKGYSVFTASNGQEGIDIFKKHAAQIDLIILDMVMPVMDGKKAFFEIQKIKKDQKIIIISGYAKREDLREILDKGALAFMSKPFQIESIVDKVAGYLNNH